MTSVSIGAADRRQQRERELGALDAAVAGSDRDAVLSAVLDALCAPGPPTVLAIEDAHWSDEVTMNVLRFAGRRIADSTTELPAVLLVTYRADETGPEHPLRTLFGAVRGPRVIRLELPPRSRAAVARSAGGTTLTSAELYRVTNGNPFVVTEVLAVPGERVPATIVDAVQSRLPRIDPAAQRALEQLSVVSSRTELPLARTLLGDLTVLAPAEHGRAAAGHAGRGDLPARAGPPGGRGNAARLDPDGPERAGARGAGRRR